MPLSWNEIKARAIAFAKEWVDAVDERAQAQTFWIEFFAVFGLTPKRLASFEHAVKKHGGGQGFVDLFWPGMLIVEHKSRGKSLDRAFGQALDYFPGIAERDLPRHVIVTDFARLRLTDLVSGDQVEFALADLHKHLRRFAFIAGYQVQTIKPQDPVNLQAAERMGRLHDALKASGYDGHALEVLLELEVLRAAYAGGQRILDVHQLIALDVDQFHGIEIEEFPAQIAQVALWLIDHQMNLRVSEEFGLYFARIPLKATPHIVRGNALRLDWAEVLPPQRCAYVLGNPPFIGAKFMDDAQRADARAVFAGIEGGGLLDFVAAWYVKALRYAMAGAPEAPRCAFVSTSSITQGEQVGVLWGWMLGQGAKIHFAHRTFQWSNEARGVAAVHCVIVGFGLGEHAPKTLFEYEDVRGEPHAVAAANINPYLIDAPDVVLPRRSRPICDVPAIGIGNKPIDDGNYLFTTEERDAFLAAEPGAKNCFRRWLGADEFINGYERWCLWLGDTPPAELRAMPQVMQRIQAVKRFRESSRSAPTRVLAATPTRFHVENMPRGTSVVIAKVSSERRSFVPMGFIGADTLCSDLLFMMPEASPYHFGILASTMHNAWVRHTCGRLESRYRYSAAIVYNNFPWPEAPGGTQRTAVEAAAQAVLDARAQFSGATLADLYDPLTMPPALLKAHDKLDAAVDAAYGKKPGALKSDAERVAFLFERYQALTSLLPAASARRRRRQPARAR